MTAAAKVKDIDPGLREDWLRLRPAILKALEWLRGSWTENQLFLAVIEDRIQFWADGDAFVFTAVEQRGSLKVVNLFLAGGDTNGALELRHMIEEWAKVKGYDGCAMVVRPAVDKIIQQRAGTAGERWERGGVLYYKELRDGR